MRYLCGNEYRIAEHVDGVYYLEGEDNWVFCDWMFEGYESPDNDEVSDAEKVDEIIELFDFEAMIQ